MRYLVRIDELKEKVEFLDQQYKIIGESIDALRELKPTIIWEGEAALKFYNMYDKYIRELDIIRANIRKFNDYLADYYDGYNEGHKNFMNKYSNVVRGDTNGKNSV